MLTRLAKQVWRILDVVSMIQGGKLVDDEYHGLETWIFMVSQRWIILSVLHLIQPFNAQFTFAGQNSASLPDSMARLANPRTLAAASDGDDGIALQTLLFKEGVYSESSITGYFGKLSKRVVIRFQEMLPAETLKPNGPDQGTGVEGSSTRAKPNTRHESSFSHCLPSGITLDDIVSTKVIRSNRPGNVVRTTVEQTLGTLKAVCKNKKLVDGSGKEIYFYHLTGCWGNPPMNYGEILQKQRDEIAELKQKHTVVEMTCNPSGLPIR